MAVISGENGAVYFNEGLDNTATTGTLVFSTGKTITSSTASGSSGGPFLDFETLGYSSGMLVTVSGCEYAVGSSGVSTTGNDRIYTITDASSGVLTVSEAIAVTSTGEAGAVRFFEAEPGIQVLGFYNWSLSYSSDALETTNFDNSSGGRNYIPGLTSWTATTDKYFQTANNEVDDWVGQTCELRLFLNYVATPASTDSSQYWKGDTVVTGIDETTPVDALVTQSVSFQGDRSLTLKTQTDPWSSGIST